MNRTFDMGVECLKLEDQKKPKPPTINDVIMDATQFYDLEIPERNEYLYPWLKEGSINLISGWRGCGKTWFALGILDAVTRGENFGMWKCKQSVPCLFLDGEMCVADDYERIESLNLYTARENPLYFYSDAYANQLGLPRAHLTNRKWRHTMMQILLDRDVKLWVVDNLASLASGLDENSKRDWDPVNGWLLHLICREMGSMQIQLRLPHHLLKQQSLENFRF